MRDIHPAGRKLHASGYFPVAGGWFPLGLGGVLVGFLYHATLKHLVLNDWARQDFDYCYLIPAVVAYLLWEARRDFFSFPARPTFMGLVAVSAGLLAYLAGELGGEYLILYFSFLLVVVGLCWTLMGWKRFSTIAVPIGFFMTAFPPPSFLYSRLTLGMQMMSSRLGVLFLRFLGVPVHSSGNVIDLGVTQLQVVDACSGLRFLIPLLIVALLLACLFKTDWWRRGLVILISFPLAVLLNGFRIGIIGYLAGVVDPGLASGVVHEITGWIMFFVGTGLMFAMMSVFVNAGKTKRAAERQANPRSMTAHEQSDAIRGTFLPKPYIVALVLMMAAYGFLQFRAQTGLVAPPTARLSAFPNKLGVWSGTRHTLDTAMIERLDLTEYLQMTFTDPAGKAVDFYVAWYETQSKGKSIHSPETCLRGGGWQFRNRQVTTVSLAGFPSSPIRLNRTLLVNRNERLLAYFWFPFQDRSLVSAYELKWFTFWNRLTRGRSDGGLIRVITAISPDAGPADADRIVQSFLSEALPELSLYLPGTGFAKERLLPSEPLRREDQP